MNRIIRFIKKHKSEILYAISLFFLFALLFFIFNTPDVKRFLIDMEAKTFDLRQRVIAESKHASKDIVIASIDDASYEYMIDRYGEWPVPREVYSEFIEHVEAQNPAVIAFDLLFVKSMKSKPYSDYRLIESISKYDNIYTAINFDDRPFGVRKPAILPQNITTEIEVQSKNMYPILFTNCRAILRGIIDSTSNIGHINTPRSQDAISRTAPLFVKYPRYIEKTVKDGAPAYSKIDYYTYLALKVAMKYLSKKEGLKVDKLIVDKNNNLILGDRKIPLTKHGEVVLNWYGESGLRAGRTFEHIPFWKILDNIDAEKNNQEPLLPKNYFKDKVVYVGSSVFSLADMKTVPTEKYMPGVELHTTLLNNIVDNNLIKKVDTNVNTVITVLFVAFVALIIYYTSSTIIASTSAILSIILYVLISIYLMQFYNLWIWVAVPIISAVMAFIGIYLFKYIIKSRDFEYTYKLATTDGLTELYNHRYFQEQMLFNIDYSKRAENHFSLILIDIDFFKKFNDEYGHQAGDAVLKQVAQTLKKSVRSTDLVCRYGGEEMAIILRNTNKEEAIFTAQKICDTIASKSYKLGPDLERGVTISLGVATFPENGDKPSQLIEYSDKGLYAAKENGRNQVGKIED